MSNYLNENGTWNLQNTKPFVQILNTEISFCQTNNFFRKFSLALASNSKAQRRENRKLTVWNIIKYRVLRRKQFFIKFEKLFNVNQGLQNGHVRNLDIVFVFQNAKFQHRQFYCTKILFLLGENNVAKKSPFGLKIVVGLDQFVIVLKIVLRVVAKKYNKMVIQSPWTIKKDIRYCYKGLNSI